MMVMMMRCSLDVMVVVYWLARTVLWETALSSIEWSRCVGWRYVIVGFMMMMVVVVVMATNLLAHVTMSRTKSTY
jgi:hypothetical protein